jgi:signal recognition particle receptor subunit beta
MRIGEIAIVGPNNEEKRLFIQSVCDKVELATDNITFGRLLINDQLMLHLYGVAVQPSSQPVAWDLLARKMLGYIVLFPWNDSESFERVKPILDHLTSRYDAAMVVAAHVANGHQPVPREFYEGGIPLTAEGKFLFCDVRNPESVRKILLTLIDSLIEKMP